VDEIFCDAGDLTKLDLYKELQREPNTISFDFPGGAQISEYHEEYCVYDIKCIINDMYKLIFNCMCEAAGHEVNS